MYLYLLSIDLNPVDLQQLPMDLKQIDLCPLSMNVNVLPVDL